METRGIWGRTCQVCNRATSLIVPFYPATETEPAHEAGAYCLACFDAYLKAEAGKSISEALRRS